MKPGIVIVMVAAAIVAGFLLLGSREERAPVPMTFPVVEDTLDGSPFSAGSVGHITPPAASASRDVRGTNLLADLLKGAEPPELTPDQIEAFLTANGRSAGSLLAAYRISREKAYFDEAKEKFPNSPEVAFTALFKSRSPEERSQWLDRFKQAAPDNALPNYLSAIDHFKAGRNDDAIQEMVSASGKPACKDYARDFAQNAEEAYRSAGFSEGESKAIGAMQVQLPQLAPLRDFGRQLGEMAKSYRQAGDETSSQAVVQFGVNLAQQLDAPEQPLLHTLVSVAIERSVLGALDPASPYGESGQTVKDRMDELTRRREETKALTKHYDALPDLSDQEVASFFDRLKLFGEAAALDWLAAKTRD